MTRSTNTIFEVTDRWGQTVVLTEEDWSRITAKRPGVAGYEEHVRGTIEHPNVVYEGRHVDSKAFYRKGLLDGDHDFRDCWVCVIVRYPAHGDPSIRTVYFPYNIQARLGRLLWMDR